MSTVQPKLLPLTHYLTEIPEKTASTLKCKALTISVLEKICWVALIAIAATVLTISYSGTVLTGGASLLVGGMVLSTLFFATGASQFKIWSNQFSERAKREERVALELRKIAAWKTPEIEQFLHEQGLSLEQTALNALKQVHREPLCALLPLIARFKCLQEEAQNLERTSKTCLAAQHPEIEDEGDRSTLCLDDWRRGWRLHEYEAIPRAMDAATMLELIQDPTRELSVLNVGQYRIKTLEEREAQHKYGRMGEKDNYFVFHKKLNRTPLTLETVEQNMDPRDLRLQLFRP